MTLFRGIPVVALVLGICSVQGARQTVEVKQKAVGNGNLCLQKVNGYDRTTFTCKTGSMAWMRQCAKKMRKYEAEGFISCQDLGCPCAKDHFCYQKPHLSAQPICLAAAAVGALTQPMLKLFHYDTHEYLESSLCEFESFGMSTRHFTETKGCVGDVVATLTSSLLQDEAESFMDISETISMADDEVAEGNGNKCLAVVESYNSVSFTCKTGSMAWMRQCAKKMQQYTSAGYVSCQDLGCACAPDYFCYKKPIVGRGFCLAASEFETLTTGAATPSAQALYESATLGGDKLFESKDCKFESFGFSARHFTETKGCEKGPGDEPVVTDVSSKLITVAS